jgi:long-chain-fatty-acid--CoA ligase ACSBG
MLSHDSITWTSRAIASFVESPPAHEQILSHLPLAHIAAQLFDIYLPIIVAGTVYFPSQDVLSVCCTHFP